MFKFVVIVCFAASASAGVLHAGIGSVSYAAGPALGTPLLGKVTYNPEEVTIVKQPVTIDQQEIRYRAVPTIVQTAPIVKHITPVVQAAPVLRTVAAAPALTYAAAPALTYAAAPALTYSAGLPVASGLTYSGLNYGAINTFGAPGLTYGLGGINTFGAFGSPAVTLLKK